jgi:uncharacterized membrane protein
MAGLIPFWILGAMVVGFLGRRQRFGFWGYFFSSILLTPIIGLLMLIAATPTRDARKAMRRGQQ